MNQEPPVEWGPLWTDELERSKEVVGVLVCHGMGQQVRFETISEVARAVRDEAKKQHGQPGDVKVHLSRVEDQFVARAEVDWLDEAGRSHAVHIYEAYWAPLTEGRVSYWDTMKFLLSAAKNGMRHSIALRSTSFYRWMFGGPQKLNIGAGTWVSLAVTLGLLVLLMALIGWAFAFVYAGVVPRLSQTLSQPSGFSWLTVLVPGLHELAYFTQLDSAARLAALGHFALWGLAIFAAYWVRYFLVQFVGDVAAYISPYKSSKFDEVRRNIQKIGLDAGRVVYGLVPSDSPNYSRIVVIGHSLGSVLAYDTLNALFNLENTVPVPGRPVVGRTRALITFGSPLDKTAYIFRMQQMNWLREQMVAAMQPLIVDYARFRPAGFTWLNIWSKWDVISGELNYYDQPNPPAPNPIQNIEDPQANVPLYAHVQYWQNDILRKKLYGLVS